MKFANPLYFLLMIPALIAFILYIRGRIGKEAVMKFSSLELVRQAGAKKITFQRIFPAFLRLLALLFLVLAIARPQTGTGEETTTQHVVDIVISLDVSGSMSTMDFAPGDRITAAKKEAENFIEGRKDDRIGLVIFAGQSVTQCPLTTDHQAILTLLNSIQLGMLEDGTAIGLGLSTAVNRLKDSTAKSKVVILLTDGVNNSGAIDPVTAAELAQQFKIRVYTIAVGRDGTAMMPVTDPRFGTRLVPVKTEIDEKTLKLIAQKTDGAFFRAQDGRSLKEIFRQIDKLEKTEITIEKHMHYEEHYFWFLWPAVILLLIEILWTNLLRVKLP